MSLIIRELGLNNNSFAKTVNVSPTVTFNIVSGRNTKPSYELLEKILFTFDNISAEWLIRGEGSMFRAKNQNIKPLTTEIASSNEDLDKLLILNQKQAVDTLKSQLETTNKINETLLEIVSKKMADKL